MKKNLIYGAVLAAMAIAAAPAANAAANWSGPYVDLGVGTVSAKVDVSNFENSGEDTAAMPSVNGQALNLGVGYDHQFSNGIVVGFKVEVGEADASGSSTQVLCDECAYYVNENVETTIKHDGLQTAALFRVGYAVGHWLPYVTAGVRSTQTTVKWVYHYEYPVYYESYYGEGLYSHTQTNKDTYTSFGPAYGLGVDYRWNNWTVGARWLHADQLVTKTSYHNEYSSPYGVDSSSDSGSATDKVDTFMLRVGYRF